MKDSTRKALGRPVPERAFQAFKCSQDGLHTKWDHVTGLTHEQARGAGGDTGLLYEYRYDPKTGIMYRTPYIWTYSLMPEFCK